MEEHTRSPLANFFVSHCQPSLITLFNTLQQVQALRSIEQYLGLEKLYVLGTNCVDNGPREGLEKFLNAASDDPETVLHYEFMQVRGFFLVP